MNHWYQESELGKYRYTVVLPIHFLVPELRLNYDITRPHEDGDKLAIVRDSIFTILPGYAFDGATGGPDFECLMREFALHDALCQLDEVPEWPISRFHADRIFFREAKKANLPLAIIYYTAIRMGGEIHKFFNPPTPADGIEVHPV